MPDEPEARGLLALMLLHHSRRDARMDERGELVLLEDQDRALWHRDEIGGGRSSWRRAPGADGPYALQAQIAAEHSRRRIDRLGARGRALRAARGACGRARWWS